MNSYEVTVTVTVKVTDDSHGEAISGVFNAVLKGFDANLTTASPEITDVQSRRLSDSEK